ncbi:MAG: aldehyde dehydrogenase family protein, partial [bacterium]
PEVGERLTQVAGLKRLLLELGSNSSVIYDDMDVPDAVIQKTVRGAFAQAGQVCISVQKLYIPKRRHDPIIPRLIEASKKLKVGDPLDPATDVGPMISDTAADRAEEWILEAANHGAELLTPWRRDGRLIHPTLLLNADESLRVCAKEAFAPVLVVNEVEDFDEALARVNASQFGLQLGVFTNRLDYVLQVAQSAEVGGVLINEIPAFRVDLMPYGGMKRSGLGREGPRYAVEEFTELKLVSLNPLPNA